MYYKKCNSIPPRYTLKVQIRPSFLITTGTILSFRDEDVPNVLRLRHVHRRVCPEEALRAERDLQALNRHPKSYINADLKHRTRVSASSLHVKKRFKRENWICHGPTHQQLRIARCLRSQWWSFPRPIYRWSRLPHHGSFRCKLGPLGHPTTLLGKERNYSPFHMDSIASILTRTVMLTAGVTIFHHLSAAQS